MRYIIVFGENIYLQAFIIWFTFIPIPIINGILRENTFRPLIGEMIAHWISTVLLIFLFLGYIYLTLAKQFVNLSDKNTLLIGLLWVSLTIIFEFSFGLFVDKQSLAHLLADYNLLSGRIWLIFVLVMFLTPFIYKRILHS